MGSYPETKNDPKNIYSRKRHCTFDSPEKLGLLSLSSSDRKMIKLLTFDNSFAPLRHSR